MAEGVGFGEESVIFGGYFISFASLLNHYPSTNQSALASITWRLIN